MTTCTVGPSAATRLGSRCLLMVAISWSVACKSADISDHHAVQPAFVGVDSRLSQFALPLTREQALEILTGTDTFADTHVGNAGAPSHQACAFVRLLNQPDAGTLFKQLLASGHLAGRLYALCGLYFTDHAWFLQAIEPYRTSRDAVTTFQGCIIMDAGVATLVERDDPTVVRLAAPTETTAEWLARHADLVADGYHLDIIGGGWPARLKEMQGCDG